jgi:hypothetical protein
LKEPVQFLSYALEKYRVASVLDPLNWEALNQWGVALEKMFLLLKEKDIMESMYKEAEEKFETAMQLRYLT